MKYLIIILALIVTGCSGGGGGSSDSKPKCKGTLFIGDSIGRQLMTSEHSPPFHYDVVGGRALTEYPEIDDSYCKVFLELGTNKERDWDFSRHG